MHNSASAEFAQSKNAGTANGHYWLSTKLIRRYLHQFLLWWTKTTFGTWQYQELISWFVQSGWDINPATHAAGSYNAFNELQETSAAI